MMDRREREKKRNRIWFLASLGILGWGGGVACMIIGNRLLTNILGVILIVGGIVSAVFAVILWYKYDRKKI